MRLAPDRPWLRFRAEQTFMGDGIDFRWEAQVHMAPLVNARVVDSFEGRKGSLLARVFGVIPVARSRGPVTDRGEAMRGLAELPWRPFGFRDGPHVTWADIGGPHKLRACFDDGSTHAAVDFDIDADGRVLGGSASNRPRIVGKTVVETPWAGSFGEYRTFEALRVPMMAEVSWMLPEGDFTYWRGRIVDFRVLR